MFGNASSDMTNTGVGTGVAPTLAINLNPEARNWKQVTFRCMIQDILGNEIYTMHDSEKMGDRTIFYCISIPGENDWVRKCPKGSRNEFMTKNGKSSDSMPVARNLDVERLPLDHPEGDRDRCMRLSVSLVNRSYPIPSNGRNKSCLIKIYDINLVEFLRVNDIVQVSGLLEPTEFEDGSHLERERPREFCGDPSCHIDHNHIPHGNKFIPDFEPAEDFPHRLVPRVHVMTLKKMNHINPLLPDLLSPSIIDKMTVRMARARLSTVLTQILGGDSVAAEYLIFSLISGIHRRKDVTSLGQLTMGLSGIKPEMKFLIDKLYELFSSITTHSHYIDLSIANLNNLCFTPTKDHENNKMIAGTLQLPDGLYLMLNETALTEGQLTALGTENLNSLSQIIRWQRHKYNFKYSSVEIDTDIKVLVFSEGKSLLQVPYTVRLEKNDPETISNIRQACDSVNDFLNEDLLNMFRYFITALKDVPDYGISDEAEKCIQQDFSNWRASNEAKGEPLFSADDLSSHMTLARYVTISRGETLLTNELWKETCQLESARQSRLLNRT